jgi:hypothetical protein
MGPHFLEVTPVATADTTEPKKKRWTPEDQRSTVVLKLRIPPADGHAVRAAAKKARTTISKYALRVFRRQRDVPAEPGQLDGLADVLRKLLAIPEAVRRLDADLGKMNGRLKDLFDIDPAKAYVHQDEINRTLFAVRDMRSAIMPELAAIQVAMTEPRDLLIEMLRAASRKRDA